MAILTSNPGQELQGTRHPHLNLPPPHQHHHHPIITIVIITIIIVIIMATTELQTKSVFH